MTTSTKGTKSFTYTGGLDGIEVHLPNHTYHFVSGETVDVCGHCAPALAQHADFISGTKKAAPADSTPKEV